MSKHMVQIGIYICIYEVWSENSNIKLSSIVYESVRTGKYKEIYTKYFLFLSELNNKVIGGKICRN